MQINIDRPMTVYQTVPPRVTDSIAPLDHIKKNGYYTVGQKIFAHKTAALQESTRTGDQVHFYFFNDEFSSMDWRQSSGVPLRELYRMRAQQLRDKYDYIICNFSGGADSTTMVESFYNNGIKLDEILISWPLRYLNRKFPVSRNISADNLMSEWDLSIRPKLEYIRRNHPDIKITIADYSDDLGTEEYSEHSLIYTAKCGYVAIKKHRAKDRVMAERQAQYPNLVALAGVNPVWCRISDDYLLATFIDEACNGYRSDWLPDGYVRNVEFFYWTGDLPEIVKEQALILLQYLNEHPEDRYMLDRWNMLPNRQWQSTPGNGERYRTVGHRLFYPTWNVDTFQAKKPKIWIGPCEWYSWYYNNPHAQPSVESWQSMIDNQLQSISKDFFVTNEGRITGFKTIENKFFVVGKLHPYQPGQ